MFPPSLRYQPTHQHQAALLPLRTQQPKQAQIAIDPYQPEDQQGHHVLQGHLDRIRIYHFMVIYKRIGL